MIPNNQSQFKLTQAQKNWEQPIQNKVIAYASKSLTQTEQRYANLEREMLASIFGAERFHTNIYGTKFTIESDHCPLDMISRKNLTAAPPQLHTMIMKLHIAQGRKSS